MSHFIAMVLIPPDMLEFGVDEALGAQLAPFDENMQVEPRPDETFDAEQIREIRGKLAEQQRDDDTTPGLDTTEMNNLEVIREWTGQTADFNEDGNVVSYTTYNPQSRWDWYVIGGRWEGCGPLTKDGNRPDIGRVGDIDWATMRQEAEVAAIEEWTLMETVTAETTMPKPWSEYREVFEDIDTARRAYHDEPWVTAVKKVIDLFLDDPVEYFCFGERDEFIAKKISNRDLPYALVTPDRQWLGRGDMGWFGMDTVTDADWPNTFHKTLEALSEDTTYVMCDLHI